MAKFGRIRLMAIAVKRFLTQLQRHEKADFDALPHDYRSRYATSESRLFADSKTAEACDKNRRLAAEDMHLMDRPLRKSQANLKPDELQKPCGDFQSAL